MTKERFIEVMSALKEYTDYEDKLDDCGIEIWKMEQVSQLVTNYVKMIAEAFSLNHNSLYGTELDYYIYELDWGRKLDAGEKKDVNSPWTSLENLYDFLIKIK